MHGEIGVQSARNGACSPPDAINVNRFAAVFDLAYRRFEDL